MKVRLTFPDGSSVEGDAEHPPREGHAFQVDIPLEADSGYDGKIITTEPVIAVLGEGVFVTEDARSYIVQIIDLNFQRFVANA